MFHSKEKIMKNQILLFFISFTFWHSLQAQECKVNLVREKSDAGLMLKAELRPADSTASIKWSTEETTPSILIKKSGEYCVRVKFNNGCVAEKCIKIQLDDSEACKVSMRAVKTNAGYILMPIFKSSAPVKEWAWNDGIKDSVFIVSNSGTYCLRAVFSNGCVAEVCEKIVLPDTCRLGFKLNPNENASGRARKLCAITSPGQKVSSYRWNTGDSTECISINDSGEYCLQVTYENGCVVRECINLFNEKECEVAIDSESIVDSLGQTSYRLCLRLPDSVQTSAVQWSTGDDDRCIRISEGGEYCVKVQLKNGCVAKACIKIERPKRCKVEITRHQGPDSSSIMLCARTAPADSLIRYKWSTGDTTACIVIKESGKYCVRVINGAGCVAEECIEIPKPKCRVRIHSERLEDGTFQLSAKLDGKPVTYAWNTGDSTRIIIVKEAGKYCVRTVFEDGCVAEDCLEIKENSCDVAIKILPNGKLQAVTEGERPYKYTWSTGDSSKNISVASSGTYCVTVTDKVGCVTETCIEYITDTTRIDGVEQGRKLRSSGLIQENNDTSLEFRSTVPTLDVLLTPNPVTNLVSLRMNVPASGRFDVHIYNTQGALVGIQHLSLDSGHNERIMDFTDLPQGLYVVRVTDGLTTLTKKLMKQ